MESAEEEETMNYAELEKLTAPARTAKRVAVGLFLALFAAWCSIATFDSRGTHAMTVAEALRAMGTPLTESERKIAVAALRRQAMDAVAKLVDEATRDTASGREAAAALAHLRTELSR